MNTEIIAGKPQKEEGPWDVAIIGSGPGGLTAAIYSSRGAASTIIFAGENWGGQLMLTTKVDNYPALPGVLGPDLMQKMKDHAVLFGAELIEKKVDKVNFKVKPFELFVGDKKYLANSVLIATGADTRWLGIPGEDKLRGRGISSCAPCDAPFFKNKAVAVVGGGDSAMEEALVLTKYANKVVLIHRRDSFRASEAMQKKVFEMEKQGKIQIIWDTEVVEVKGENALESITLKSKDGSQEDISVDGLFIAIGHVPSTGIFKDQVELDEKGYVKKKVNNGVNMATSVPGVFVAGDVHDFHYRQAVTAAGFGCMAAMEALKFLDKEPPSW